MKGWFREAMDEAHNTNPDIFDPTKDIEEGLSTDDRKSNPFMKLLGNLRGTSIPCALWRACAEYGQVVCSLRIRRSRRRTRRFRTSGPSKARNPCRPNPVPSSLPVTPARVPNPRRLPHVCFLSRVSGYLYLTVEQLRVRRLTRSLSRKSRTKATVVTAQARRRRRKRKRRNPPPNLFARSRHLLPLRRQRLRRPRRRRQRVLPSYPGARQLRPSTPAYPITNGRI